jgi:hypothetical protein
VVEPIPRRRRRSRREPEPAGGAPTADFAAAFSAPDPVDPDEEAASERGLRGLVGGGSSQVNVRAALRARDATRPRAADLAAAESNLVIIRRGWTPPAESR